MTGGGHHEDRRPVAPLGHPGLIMSSRMQTPWLLKAKKQQDGIGLQRLHANDDDMITYRTNHILFQ